MSAIKYSIIAHLLSFKLWKKTMNEVTKILWCANTIFHLFIYLGFCIDFNTEQVISQRVVGMAEGNQYIQFIRVLCCKLLTNGKQLPAFPLEAVPVIKPRPQRWEARVCHHGLPCSIDKVGVLRPVQQPGSYWDRSSELPLVGLEPTEVTAYD